MLACTLFRLLLADWKVASKVTWKGDLDQRLINGFLGGIRVAVC